MKIATISPTVVDGPPRLFAMVSTKKSRKYTPYALSSFFETTSLRKEDNFILINNDDPEFNEIIAPFKSAVTVLDNQIPHSFAHNANQMIAQALSSGSDLFFMNNDIIFTDNWLSPLAGEPDTILSPISNREVQFVGSVVVVKTKHIANTVVTQAPMDLESYTASPRMFQAIAEANSKCSTGLLKLIVYPFFCVRIPLGVMQVVGRFDESFGTAGGEDYDYCFRAWLAGFKVQMALASYLIHFWGKSTWTAESKTASASDNYSTQFLEVFKAKWGEPLFEFVLRENDQQIRANPLATALRESGDLAGLIRLLAPQRRG